MPKIRANIIANYAGTFWSTLMSLIFVPLYIHFMGIESYGLVGVFASLLGIFALLDMGLSATMNREMARLSALPDTSQHSRDLTRTLEILYWGVAICIGASVIVLSGPIAHHWVNPKGLSRETVEQAIMIMGLVAALRWPVSFYSGGLMGLERQVAVNAITAVCATIRGVGAVLVLWLVSPTIQAFFLWQIVSSTVETASLTLALWLCLPAGRRKPRFDTAALRSVWRFSAGMTGISIAVLILMQTDKVILSRMLSLEMFGYYTLAWAVTAAVGRSFSPVVAAVYPELTRLTALKDQGGLAAIYHKSAQSVAVTMLPAVVVLGLFSDRLLFVWAGPGPIVDHASTLVAILAVGTCLNGFMHIPYSAQLAAGWTSLSFWKNVVAVVVLVPLLIVLTKEYGAVGGAAVWVILNSGYVVFEISIMHRRILVGEKCYWYLYDVALPILTALAVALPGKELMPEGLSRIEAAVYLCMVGGITLAAGALTATRIRPLVMERVRRVTKGCEAWGW